MKQYFVQVAVQTISHVTYMVDAKDIHDAIQAVMDNYEGDETKRQHIVSERVAVLECSCNQSKGGSQGPDDDDDEDDEDDDDDDEDLDELHKLDDKFDKDQERLSPIPAALGSL